MDWILLPHKLYPFLDRTQMMSGNPNLFDMYVHHPPYYHCHQPPQAPPPPSASPHFFQSQFVFGSSSLPLPPPPHDPSWFSSVSCPLLDHEQLPHSWSQLLLGGLPNEEEGHFQTREPCDRWESEQEEEITNPTHGASALKKEAASLKVMPTPSWTHMVIPASSPTSCVTSLSGGNVWDFSKNAKEGVKNLNSGHPSEYISTATGGACKKARVHPPSTQPPLKVRKEKLGDRVTALHQLVSPFGKTDTASVLLEAIGYIRFLHGQIEVLSSPYFRSEDGPGNTRSTSRVALKVAGEEDKYVGFISGDTLQPADLRSRGLCLVPVSCTAQVGSGDDNGADYWAPAFGGGF